MTAGEQLDLLECGADLLAIAASTAEGDRRVRWALASCHLWRLARETLRSDLVVDAAMLEQPRREMVEASIWLESDAEIGSEFSRQGHRWVAMADVAVDGGRARTIEGPRHA